MQLEEVTGEGLFHKSLLMQWRDDSVGLFAEPNNLSHWIPLNHMLEGENQLPLGAF